MFVNSGYNLRPTEVDAAIGLVQLPKLDGFVSARRKAAALLRAGLAEFSRDLRPQKEQPGGASSWFGFPLVVEKDAPFSAQELREHLTQHEIETRPIIAGNMIRQPGMKLFAFRSDGNHPNAQQVMDSGFSLPCHQGIGEDEVSKMVNVIRSFVRAR